MRVAVTGTPGTGKTTATDLVETDLAVIHLNEVIREEGLTEGRDDERDTLVADLDAVEAWLERRERETEAGLLIESHLAHRLHVDRVIVLRCRPGELKRRLRDRDEPEESADENAESEALDIVLTQAVERHGLDAVYEIDATDLGPEAVAGEIEAVLAGEREPSAGGVSFIDYLDSTDD